MRVPGALRLTDPRRVLVVAVAAALVLAAAGPAAELRPGCGRVPAGSITESQAFVPGNLQKGPMKGDAPVNPSGKGATVPKRAGLAPATLGGQPLSYVRPLGRGVKLYYLTGGIDAEMTSTEFLAAGGLRLEHQPREDMSDTAAGIVLATAGDRAIAVAIGPYEGALVWADPTPLTELRTHNLYWSDGVEEYAIIGVLGPEAIVNLGRNVVCGTS